MIFTGYRLEELDSNAAREVFAHTDIVVAGRFIPGERDESLCWRGSGNQRVHFLTKRYSSKALHATNTAEVVIRGNGETQVTGFPSKALLGKLSLKLPVYNACVPSCHLDGL